MHQNPSIRTHFTAVFVFAHLKLLRTLHLAKNAPPSDMGPDPPLQPPALSNNDKLVLLSYESFLVALHVQRKNNVAKCTNS